MKVAYSSKASLNSSYDSTLQESTILHSSENNPNTVLLSNFSISSGRKLYNFLAPTDAALALFVRRTMRRSTKSLHWIRNSTTQVPIPRAVQFLLTKTLSNTDITKSKRNIQSRLSTVSSRLQLCENRALACPTEYINVPTDVVIARKRPSAEQIIKKETGVTNGTLDSTRATLGTRSSRKGIPSLKSTKDRERKLASCVSNIVKGSINLSPVTYRYST